MKNAEQLKALSKNFATKKKIAADVVLHTYMLERLLERIYKSEYKQNFIIKGGILIASMFGLESRSTVDIDAIIKSYPLNIESLRKALQDILKTEINDGVMFEIYNIEPIREENFYQGFRVTFKSLFDGIVVFIKTDISTGDIVVPKEVLYQYSLILENRTIEISAYNIETILAEKFEIIISRSLLNTRMKDFYDIYMLINYRIENIDKQLLSKAINTVLANRNTDKLLPDLNNILTEIMEDKDMYKRWESYCKKYPYAKNLSWENITSALTELSTICFG